MGKNKISNFQFSSFIKNKLTYNLSFTLIELLIVITFLLFFSGLSLAYYNNLTEEKKFETETQKLVDILELAKKKATTGDLFTNCLDFRGYQINITASSYTLNFCCADTCNTTVKSYSLPTNIVITSGVDTIQFKPLTTSISPKNIIIKNNSLNKCINVSINSAGIIEIGNQYTC